MPAVQRPRPSRSVAAHGENAAFTIPTSHHLIITTPGHVHAVDKAGSRKIFSSSSKGILAAKEAKDGNGTLAISDSHNVILHRIEEGLERSYRLKGSKGQIRLLEFAPDSKTLFFTTTLLHAVQTYSLSEARLLEPGPLHISAPTVVAISPLSHMLLTASEEPPLIYLQNRTMGTQPLLIQPLASQAPVAKACFHSDRPNVFLLAFKDGTLAAYDGSQLLRSVDKGTGYPQAVGGELYVFRHLHAVSSTGVVDPGDNFSPAALGGLDIGTNAVTSGAGSMSVTGVAFVPGHRGRAVTCGADGKCRVIDFEKGCTVRSWHARAPATSLSILPSKSGKAPLVAVGKIDGKVAIHDMSGTLLQEFMLGDIGFDRIIDVEWIKGCCPNVIDGASPIKVVDETWIELYAVNGTLRSRKTRSSHDTTDSNHFGAQSGDGNISTVDTPGAEATGTICRRPAGCKDDEQSSELPGDNYMDLFSPVKLRQSPPARPPNSPRRRSTPRYRPRISSSTFVNQVSEQAASFGVINSTARRNPRATDERTAPPRHRSSEQTTAFTSSFDQARPRPRKIEKSILTRDSATSKILVDIKRHGGPGGSKRTLGNLALFAPYLPPPKGTIKKKPASNRRTSRARKLSILHFSPKRSSPDKRCSVTESNRSTLGGQDDIWLTAESDVEKNIVMQQTHESQREERSSRRLMWPAERAKSRQVLEQAAVSHRPSIELQMSPPVARTFAAKALQEQSLVDSRPKLMTQPQSKRSYVADASPSSMAPSTDLSRPSTSDQTPYDTGDETIMPESPLRPGFAQSFQGPVNVDRYLPRKSSLAFPSSPPGSPKRRPALGELSGNEQRVSENGGSRTKVHDERTCQCCLKVKDEIQMLRDEIAELRRLVKGKERTD